MAGNRDIHGSVVLDVTTEGEQTAKERLQAAFANVVANVEVNASFKRKQIQAALDVEASKGRGLRVDVAAVFSKAQMQRDLNEKAKGGRPLKVRVDAQFSRPQIQRAIRESIAGNAPKIRIDADIRRGTFSTVVADAQNAAKEITDFEQKQNVIRETQRLGSVRRTNDKVRAQESKGDQDRATDRQRALNRLDVLEDQHVKRLLQFEAAAAQRREVINAQLRARIEAQDNLFRQRQILAAERAAARINSKPILQRILLNTNAFNQSLAEFDRTVSRFLRTSLLAFGVWSTAVTAAVAGVGIAGAVAFAKLEDAATRAATVVATQQRVDEINRFGQAISDFGATTDRVQRQVEERAQQVALTTRGFDPTAISTGIQSLVQAGQSLDEAFINIGSAANFASVNQADLKETTDGLATSLAGAGLGANDSARLLDQISFTAASAVGDVKDYFDAFANGAGAAGRIIGATSEETLFFLKLLGQSGQVGLQAGTSIDIIFRDLGRAAIKAGDEWEKYGLRANAPLGEQIVLLADLVEKTGDNRIAQAQLRKDLGFQEKSFRAISRILPQVTALGATTQERIAGVNREILNIGENSAGTVELQLREQRKNVGFQFDQLIDTVKGAFQDLGRTFGPSIAALLDQFAGTGGLVDQATKRIESYGDSFGRVFDRITAFVQTDNFVNGLLTIEEAVKVTLGGVADAFSAFSSAFQDDATESQSVFESFADSILAFSRLSATVLPVIAKFFGQVFDFLIDNADAFETFAKITLTIYALRKAFTLLVQPALTAAEALRKVRGALIATASTQAASGFVAGISQIAAAYGLLGKEAKIAAANVALLDVANSAVFPTLGRGGRGAQAAAGTRGQGGAIGATAANAALLAPDLNRIFRGGGAGADAARAGAAFEKIAPAATRSAGPMGRVVGLFTKFAGVFEKLVPAFVKGIPVIGRVATALAKFGGPIALITAAIEGVIGIFRGFFEEIGKTKDEGSEVGRTFKELQPIFRAIFDATKQVFQIVFDILGVIGRIGQSLGRVLGGIFNDALINFGDTVRGIKALFEGDLIGALKAFGDVIINTITQPFRLAIGLVIDLVADLLGNFENVPIIGDKVKDVTNAVRDAASGVRDFRVNMSAAEVETEKTKKATQELTLASQQAALSAKDLTLQQQTISRVASLSAVAFQRASARSVVFLDETKGAVQGVDGASKNLLGTVGGFEPTFQGIATSGVGAMKRLESQATSTTASLLAQQAALQASLGQTANSMNSLINSGLQQALSNAQAGIGPFTEEQVRGQIAAQAEQERRQKLIAAARRSRRDQKIIEDALGTGSQELSSAPTTGTAAQPVQRTFTDPDDAIQRSIDRLKPAQKAAQVQALITKVTAEQGRAYALTRRDTLLLAESMPRIDKAIEVQRKKVEELTTALDELRNVQIKGTQAFSDAAFENEQAIKRLQLQRLDALAVPGTTESSAAIVALDQQIEALQKSAERASLVESLELDPLRRQLEQTFNPVREDTFANIMARFKELSAAQETQTAKLTGQEAIQAKLNERLTAAQERYTKIDEAAQRSVEAFNSAQQAASGAATSFSAVGASAASGAKSVNKYSTAVENVPTGKGVVDKSLKGINDRVTELAGQFTNAGTRIVTLYTQGINQALVDILQPALARVVERTLIYLRTPISPAKDAGEAIMGGFLAGLKEGFGSPEKVGSVAWYLNVFIPKWIRENKGPVAYDATILVPAGHAVMEGFGRGLREGFSQVQGFVKDVGPSLKEFISGDAFSKRTATIMADIAVGKTPDIEGVFGDLREAMTITTGYFPGAADPALSFLHPTLSLADTIQQAFGIVKALGGGLNTGGPGQLGRPDGSTPNNSRHEDGVAADIGTGSSQPTAASLKLFEQAKKLLGTVFKEIIHNGVGLEAGGGSFPDSQHFDHVHLEWLQGKGFDENSGKIGKPLVTDIPGAPPIIDQALNAAAKKYGVELALVAAIAKQESKFDPRVTSPAGAGGLMQLMPATARSLGVSNVFDPFQNADGGTKYLKQLLHRFGGRYNLAMGGYNAGPNAPGLDEGRLPPYSETRNYVRLVTGYLEEFRRKFGGFREAGGPVSAGRAYVVGEKRPEIFVPNRPGMILPDAAATLSSAGTTYQDNRTITNTVQTQATDPEAVADVLEARTRSSMTGVIFR